MWIKIWSQFSMLYKSEWHLALKNSHWNQRRNEGSCSETAALGDAQGWPWVRILRRKSSPRFSLDFLQNQFLHVCREDNNLPLKFYQEIIKTNTNTSQCCFLSGVSRQRKDAQAGLIKQLLQACEIFTIYMYTGRKEGKESWSNSWWNTA